jgi:hypothetical protein
MSDAASLFLYTGVTCERFQIYGNKLRKIGIDGNLLSWDTDYLDDRKQKVVLDGFSSGWKGIDAGVPQGSVLDPFLILIYINDIVDDHENPSKTTFCFLSSK